MSRRWLGISNAAAAGLMLGASHALVAEGAALHAPQTVAGLVVGALFVAISFRLLRDRKDVHVGQLEGAGASKATLIVAVMTLHSMAEGIGVGVSFGGGEALATFVTAAIAVHNIPEGLAISLVLMPQGVSVWKAAGWSVFSSLPFGLGFAAGAMIWVAVGELLSDAFKDALHSTIARGLEAGTLLIEGYRQLAYLIQINGHVKKARYLNNSLLVLTNVAF